MKFFKKEDKTKTNFLKSKDVRSRKKFLKIIYISVIVILLAIVAFVSYLLSSSSKIFENGLSGMSLIKSLYSKETLKGEKDGRINILLLGVGGNGHAGGMLADSIMIVSIRPKDNNVAMLSVPRDLQVSIPGHNDTKINASTSYGYSDYVKKCSKPNSSACRDEATIAGANLAVETVNETFGLPIHYYVILDFKGFEEIIDHFGGVEINNQYSLSDPSYPCDDDEAKSCGFKLKAGLQSVDGNTALKYARCRKGNCGNDFGRAARQQEIVMALKDKVVSLNFLANPKKVAEISGSLGSSIKTNFATSEIKTALSLFSQLDRDKMISKVLTTGPDGELKDYNNGGYFLMPKTGNFKEIQNLARNIFNLDKVEKPKIEVLNGSKTTGLAGDLAKELEYDNGLDVISIDNAGGDYEKTVIYDFSDGDFPNTLSLIEDKYDIVNVVPETDISKKINKSADLVIVIGNDFKSN